MADAKVLDVISLSSIVDLGKISRENPKIRYRLRSTGRSLKWLTTSHGVVAR